MEKENQNKKLIGDIVIFEVSGGGFLTFINNRNHPDGDTTLIEKNEIFIICDTSFLKKQKYDGFANFIDMCILSTQEAQRHYNFKNYKKSEYVERIDLSNKAAGFRLMNVKTNIEIWVSEFDLGYFKFL